MPALPPCNSEDKLKRKKVSTIVLAALIALTLAFIWAHSMRSIPASRAESLGVLARVRPFLEFFVGKGNATDHLVRKLAHFLEFGALGAEFVILIAARKRETWKHIVICLFFGLAAAAADETIQIFYHRGSQVRDVLLDFAGCCAGMLFAGLLAWLIRAVRRRKDSRRPPAAP